jgi:hypothetical protein
MSHFQFMPTLTPFLAIHQSESFLPAIPAMLTTMRPSQPSWHLQPWYELQQEFVLALEVLQGHFPDCTLQNLAQEHNFELGIPTSEEPELPDLDFG